MTTVSEDNWVAPLHPPRRQPTTLSPAEPPRPARWRVLLVAGLLATLALAAALWPRGPSDPVDLSNVERTQLVAAADLATVRVSARACPGVTTGSGFVVGTVMFTTAHLVAFESSVKVDRPGQPVVAGVLASSAAVDVAVVDASWLVARPLPIRQRDLPDQSAVVVAGHPDGGELAVVDGTLRAYAPSAEWGLDGERVMLIDAPVGGGFSGGPVLDRTGSVAGMLVGVDATTGLSVAVPGDELHAVADAADAVWGNGSGLVVHAPAPCPERG